MKAIAVVVLAVILLYGGVAQSAPIVQGALARPLGIVIEQTHYYPDKDQVTLRVMNTSKDATAWNIKIVETYQDGRTNIREHNEDVLPLVYAVQSGEIIGQGKGTFDAGSSRDVIIYVQPGLVNVQASIDTVIYADKTAETTNSEALERMTTYRKVYGQTIAQANQIIQSALANASDQTPGETAANKIDALGKSWEGQKHTAIDLDTGLLQGISSNLRNAKQIAANQKTDVRTYLASFSAKETQRASFMSAHAAVGGAK